MPVIPIGIGTYFCIESKQSNLFTPPYPRSHVIEIENGDKLQKFKLGDALKVKALQNPPPDYQLWTLTGVAAIANYYFIQSKVNHEGNPLAIDVPLEDWAKHQGSDFPGRGTQLDAWTRKDPNAGSGENVFNQLWCFYPGGTEPGWYFINTLMSPLNGLVIDVPRSDLSKPLQVYSQKSAPPSDPLKLHNQLWRFIDEHGNHWTPPPPPRSTGT
jgi:hypothetical protein